MFKSAIYSTPFTSEAANNLFKNITGFDFGGDISFISTLRALIYPRMSDDDSLRLYFSNIGYDMDTIHSNSAKRVFDAICCNLKHENSISIHNFTGSEESADHCMGLIRDSFETYRQGYHILQKVTDFFRSVLSVVCFVNPESKSVCIFTKGLNLRTMHYLQCGIFAYFPWYFDPEAGVSEVEMELINSLREKTETAYLGCLQKLAEKYDFRSAFIKSKLSDFERRISLAELENAKQSVSQIIKDITSYNEAISSLLVKKNDLDLRVLGLKAKLDEAGGNIMNYFLCVKNLTLCGVGEDWLEFICSGYLTYWDEDLAKNAINNRRSYVYQDVDEIGTPEDIKELMTEIFINQNIRIKMCAAYCLDFKRMYCSGVGDYDFDKYITNDSIPNTHIDRYRCLGNYERIINQELTNNNYIGAIEQCIASSESLNFADSTVMESFIPNLCQTKRKCLEMADGTMVSPKEAINWLKKRSAEVSHE